MGDDRRDFERYATIRNLAFVYGHDVDGNEGKSRSQNYIPLNSFDSPNGSDWSIAFEKAMNSGEAVVIPRGTFIIENGKIPSNREIVGASKTQSIIKLADGANTDIFVNSDQSGGNTGIVIKNLTLDGNKANQEAFTPSTNHRGIYFVGAFDLTIENVVVQNCAGNGYFISGNALKQGPAFLHNLQANNNSNIGIRVASGFRRVIASNILAMGNGSAGIMDDVSAMMATGLYAWNNGADDAAYGCGIYIRNVTGCNLVGLIAGSNARHGIVVSGMRHSSGASWSAFQSGWLTDNTYDDVHFQANDDPAGYGENESITIAGIRTGKDIQLGDGTDSANNHERYGLYFGDESNTDITITGWVSGLNAKTDKIKWPTAQGSLSVNGSVVSAAQTSAKSLKRWESGREFTNKGTTARVDFTLPAALPGIEYDFTCLDTDGLRVIASSGAVIRLPDGTTSAANGRIDATTIGATVKVRAVSTSEWQVKGSQAGWTAT